MNFKNERDLSNLVFTTKIKFVSYGGEYITPQEEQELVENFGNPIISIGGEQYVGKYKYDTDTKEFIEDEDGDEVRFVLNSTKMILDEKFEITYTIDAKKLPKTEYENNTYLTTAALVAEAKCLLFETKIKEILTQAINKLRVNISYFDKDTPEFFVI